jgi:hypothetical protein
MLEELAGLYYLWFDMGYIDFYYKPTAMIDEQVFAGEYASVSSALPYDWSRYGLVQLATDNA